ncbi:MAG: HAMP domain-containing sensor histidine kinase [Xenococcaceae cyanobacterium MO_188.B32]|nr:HAMP domain-containing sensor histidine kinase [Xenococcaceae cyanobacterium MO_188.B32]
MSLITILTQFLRQTFPYIRKRLLLAYIIIMTIILGTAETSLYFFLIHILHQQLDHELLTLVEVATPSLNTIETRGIESLERNLSWRNFFSQEQQSLEWYDADGTLLAKEGNLASYLPLSLDRVKEQKDAPLFQQDANIRAVTISVYESDLEDTDIILKGYIRASESTTNIQSTFSKLRLGLGLGGSTALILVSISSIYLTQQAVKPIQKVFFHLGQFTSDISHQLRTPLTRISMATEILLTHKEAIQPSDARKINIINGATEQMKRLIEDMLFLLRNDSFPNSTKLEKKTISLNQLLQEVIEEFEPAFARQGIEFQAQLVNRVLIKGDTAHLHRLFANILDNSLSYTHPGDKVHLYVEKYRRKIAICIQDTGIGIASDDLPHIFQYFWRSEVAKQQQRDRFGLGLTIAQTVAKQHNGDIFVTSKVGSGSLFKVVLPIV